MNKGSVTIDLPGMERAERVDKRRRRDACVFEYFRGSAPLLYQQLDASRSSGYVRSSQREFQLQAVATAGTRRRSYFCAPFEGSSISDA